MNLRVLTGISLAILTLVPFYMHGADKDVTVELKNTQGQSVGTATLSPSGMGLEVSLDLRNLPPGEHAIHIHQVAKCDGPAFKRRWALQSGQQEARP